MSVLFFLMAITVLVALIYMLEIEIGKNHKLTHKADADIIHGKAADGLPHKSSGSGSFMSNDQITGLKLHAIFYWGVLSPIFFSSKFELIDLLLLCIFNGLLIFFGFKKYLPELENTPAEIIDKSRLDECLREKKRLELQ